MLHFTYVLFLLSGDEEWSISLGLVQKVREEIVADTSLVLGRSGSGRCVSDAREWTPGDKVATQGEKTPDVWHILSGTWFYHPNPPCVWFYLDLSLCHFPPPPPCLSWTPLSYFSLFPPIIHLGFCFSSLILTRFLTPHPPQPPLSLLSSIYHPSLFPRLPLSDFLLSSLPDGHN